MDLDIEKIAKMVQERTNINMEQARTAVTTVIEQVREKLPKDLAKEFGDMLKEVPLPAGLKR